MSLMTKLIIPLLDNKLKREDLDPESGFVDAFTSDKNRPYLDHHIFLMYSLENKNKKYSEREARFFDMNNIYNWTVAYIDGKPYKIYAFPEIEPDIKQLHKGEIPRLKDNVSKILTFWLGWDKDVENLFIGSRIGRFKHINDSVPEYDYLPETAFNQIG